MPSTERRRTKKHRGEEKPERSNGPGEVIRLRGVRQNNLRGFDLNIPLGKLNVVTGPSGSGKSSLAFDTVYAEGQRRYVETFSPYTRQFLDRMDKPDVDSVEGIPPAIAIQQSNNVRTTRSTVGTMTEINDYLKMLMPQVATAFCPSCGEPVEPETAQSVAAKTMSEFAGRNVLVVFPVPVPPGTRPASFFEFLNAQGFTRVLLRGKVVRTDEQPGEAKLPAIMPVVQDRVTAEPGSLSRLREAIESAMHLGKGVVRILDAENGGAGRSFSTSWHCAACDISLRPPTPALFTFNNPQGACPECRGFGRVIGIDLDKALPNKRISIRGGVVKPFQSGQALECQRDLLRACEREYIDVDAPFESLPVEDQQFVLYGANRNPADDGDALWREGLWYGVKGFFDWMESKTYKMHVRVFLSRYRAYTRCKKCGGGRYQPETLAYKIPGPKGRWLTLPEVNALPVVEAARILANPALATSRRTEPNPATEMLQREVTTRLRYLIEVGLGYLTLDRATRTLSGGEIERVNLTSCLGASLVNSLFVLDEPSIGLHPRDIGQLVRVMQQLRDNGNTLLVVEHEEAVIRAADNLIDLGPGRGEHGGQLVFNGPLGSLHEAAGSLTAAYLSGKKSIPLPSRRRTWRKAIHVLGARENNLANIDVKFPLGVFTCVTGVSGSGKSTLVQSVLAANLLHRFGKTTDEEPGQCREIKGLEAIDDVVVVDQSPLSRTPRSTPAVYVGAFDAIREVFASSPDAVAAGLKSGAFSFNSGDGRCERCGGTGSERIEMQFLSDLYIRCPECEGRRYQPHILKIRLAGHSIADVLDLTVTQGIAFFEQLEAKQAAAAVAPLRSLEEVGLGYLKLGQPLNTLSGGESQRLKLVERLVARSTNKEKALLIFDEPTTGLHFDDIALLLKAFHRLVDAGDTLVVVEHNLEVIKCADHVIDLGPEAGAGGGRIVASGTPEQVAACPESWTGQYLRDILPDASVKLHGARLPEAPEASAIPGTYEHLQPPAAKAAEEPIAYSAQSTRPPANVIRVAGAREHNLKNISLDIPRDQFVIVTGLSGSGKSTLAFDILFNEGQRRFLDSMSPYARQFVEQMEKPDVDLITGLPPTVAIEQRITRGGGKSTVATVTEVYHFLRLLFAKLGTQYCPECGVAVEKQNASTIAAEVAKLARKGRVRLLAPLVKARKGYHTEVARWAEAHGYETLLVDGKLVPSANFERLERFREHSIDVVLGEADPEDTAATLKLVREALGVGKGTARILDHRNKLHVVSSEMSCPSCGRAFEELDPRLFSFNSPHGWCQTCRGFGETLVHPPSLIDRTESVLEAELEEERAYEMAGQDETRPCPECEGARLNDVARAVRLGPLSMADFAAASVSETPALLAKLKFPKDRQPVAASILPEILQRLAFMKKVGLGYLALGRSAKTLSGGESQRIRLAAQLGSNLRGVLYVLDEPTIGLHPRDNIALLDTLERLREKGNSLLVVEHDDETIRRADHIIDLGPGAGLHGGEVVAAGTFADIVSNPASPTGRCLAARAGKASALVHPRRRIDHTTPLLTLHGATANNLKDIDVSFPIGRLTVLTGVSGSGKSSLMRGSLLDALQHREPRHTAGHGTHAMRKTCADAPHTRRTWRALEGREHVEAVFEVDQSPIGKTSRSTPATYVKIWDDIRALFAQTPVARMRGYDKSRFSFNTEQGRCETCSGQGVVKLEMAFLPTTYVPCHDCHGMRFNPATLEATYNDRHIGHVLDMTIEQAAEFFAAHPAIHRPLALLVETGLGYLKLGQPSPTLSGGEAQRLKLVTQLKRGVGRAANAVLRQSRTPRSTVYLLEEPTIGLHMADVARLLDVLQRLVDEGNTVIVIEHNLDLIAAADHVIEIGPEAGAAGGRIVAQGTPEKIARLKSSRIAPFLRQVLKTPE